MRGSRVSRTLRVYTGCVCILSCFSCVWLFVTLWTVACQDPLSMGFSRLEYGSELPCPSPGDISDPGIKPASPAPPELQADSLPLSHGGNPYSGIPYFTVFRRYCSFVLFCFFLQIEGFQQVYRHHFVNSICSLCVPRSCFGNSHHISNVFIFIIFVMVICDQ